MRLETNNNSEELFIRYNNLRGYLAIVVLLSHIWGYTGLVYLVPFNKIVTIAVAMFFFLSGWGMIRSAGKKEHYVKEIFITKIPFLLWMAMLAYVFSAILENVLLANSETAEFLPLSIIRFVKSTNWYVWELIGFYLIFSICIRYIRKQYWLLMVGGLSAVAFVVLFHMDVVEAYYNSIIGFVVGMYWGSRTVESPNARGAKTQICAVIVLIISFGCMFVLNHESILFAVVRNIAAVAGIVLVLWVLQYWNPVDSVSKWLSKISPELYFYHMPIALIFSKLSMNVTLYVVSVIITSTVVAVVFNIIDKWVQKRLKKCTCK